MSRPEAKGDSPVVKLPETVGANIVKPLEELKALATTHATLTLDVSAARTVDAVGAELLLRVFNAFKRASHELHVLVVDDRSPDGTAEVVRELAQRYPTLHLLSGEKRGLGEAYQRGFRWALDHLKPDLLLQMDADLQHPADLLPLFVTLTNYQFSLVIGSRFAPGGATPDFSFRRRAMSLFGNGLIRLLGGLPRIHDCTSGFRCIKASLIEKCDLSFLSTRGYSFQSSLLCELLRNGARPVEIPMVFGARGSGTSKLTLRDQVEFLLNIGKIRFRRSEEFIKFCVVGASGVVVNVGLYYLLTRFAGLALEIASPIAIECSILWNLGLNDLWTFRRRQTAARFPKRFPRFHGVSGVAALVNYGLLVLLARALGVWDIAANLVGIVAGMLINYSLNSLWTWKEIEGKGAAD